MLLRQLHTGATEVKTEVLYKLLDVTAAMLRGDFSKRIVLDFDDEVITKIAGNINVMCDQSQLNSNASDVENQVTTFIEVISSFANLDFKQKLPISEDGTIMDAIATGINLLGDELEQSTASKTELEGERNRLREAQAIARVGSWEIDMKSMEFTMSEEAYRILEIDRTSENNFLEIYARYRSKIHAGDVSCVDECMKEALSQARGFVFEHRLIGRDGEKTILCIGETVTTKEQSVRLLKGTFQDITERKRVEQALSLAKEQAEESNRAKSRFLANMSHEIRTPLNGILGLTDILSREELSVEHKNYIELIRYSGKNLAQLINDILDLSKIESGKLTLESIPFPFRSTVDSTIAPYAHLASQKGLSFKCHIANDVPDMVVGDPTRIAQIIVNLLGNAIKFTTAGSVEIHFDVHSQSNDSLVLKGRVKDTGIGIAKEKLETVFESFSQADDAISRKFGGTGLGLSIVKNLIGQMNGSIAIESPGDAERRNGTVFTFFVQLGKIQKAQNVISLPSSQLQFERKLSVLVVDDNALNLLVANKMLQRLGAEVTTADGGEDALRLCADRTFDLIFMDIQMPVMNGYETTQAFRSRGYTNPIIALSANAYREDVESSLSAGMNAHLQKPFSERQLFDVVSAHVK